MNKTKRSINKRAISLHKVSKTNIYWGAVFIIGAVCLIVSLTIIVPLGQNTLSTIQNISKTNTSIFTLEVKKADLVKKEEKIKQAVKKIEQFIDFFPSQAEQEKFVKDIESVASSTGLHVSDINFSNPLTIDKMPTKTDNIASSTASSATSANYPIGVASISITLSDGQWDKITPFVEQLSQLDKATSVDQISFSQSHVSITIKQYISQSLPEVYEK